MSKDYIHVKGAEERNLKNIDVNIPHGEFNVVTGVSGSGKTSLAFETVYSEGQRRYIESLSAYARNFLGQMDKPKVESVEGLSPAISIDQKNSANNPRSTVGTVTEIHDYLRLLYARVGVPHCPICGREVGEQSPQKMVDRVLDFPINTKIKIAAPIVRDQKGSFADLINDLVSRGYSRIRIDGEEYDAAYDSPSLDENHNHTIDVIVDRIKVKKEIRSRITDSIETGLDESDGILKIIIPDPPKELDLDIGTETRSTGDLSNDKEDVTEEVVIEFSRDRACINCGIDISEIETRSFSFNSPHGACPECEGIGETKEISEDLVVKDPSKPIKDVFEAWNYNKSYYKTRINAVANHFGINLSTPFEDLSSNIQESFLYGTNEDIVFERKTNNSRRRKEKPFEGVIPNLERRHKETESRRTREKIEEYMSVSVCQECNGTRVKPESRSVLIDGVSITEINKMSINDALEHFEGLEKNLTKRNRKIAEEILKEIRQRLEFMCEVGLNYLTLDREASTLSGGESQRIRLATQIGSGLVGVLYVLDEPSIGLHQRDNNRLLNTLEELCNLGNTLLVVEHDKDTMRRADTIIDLGPGPGKHGGEVVAKGSVDDIKESSESLTGDYLSGRKKIKVPEKRRSSEKTLTVKGAKQHNLKNIDVEIPLKVFTAITGVSGSGKSTLIHEILYKALAQRMNNKDTNPGKYEDIDGIEHIDSVRLIDQSPIGRTPRSNPATYTGVFDYIRKLFAEIKLAKQRGYDKGRFSFNVKKGRCEQCRGQGKVKIDMNFLSDVYVSCEQCNGKRYDNETLDIEYKNKTISGILQMTVGEAYDFFKNNNKIRGKLQLLKDVGLDYMRLGQPSTRLSGGEAQRIKLAEELGKKDKGNTLYLLDEPTTGLHPHDEKKLINVLHSLTQNNNSVVVIEHELDLIKNADYIIDLGPEGGKNGGRIIAKGTPEKIAKNQKSYTGKYLRDELPKINLKEQTKKQTVDT